MSERQKIVRALCVVWVVLWLGLALAFTHVPAAHAATITYWEASPAIEGWGAYSPYSKGEVFKAKQFTTAAQGYGGRRLMWSGNWVISPGGGAGLTIVQSPQVAQRFGDMGGALLSADATDTNAALVSIRILRWVEAKTPFSIGLGSDTQAFTVAGRQVYAYNNTMWPGTGTISRGYHTLMGVGGSGTGPWQDRTAATYGLSGYLLAKRDTTGSPQWTIQAKYTDEIRSTGMYGVNWQTDSFTASGALDPEIVLYGAQQWNSYKDGGGGTVAFVSTQDWTNAYPNQSTVEIPVTSMVELETSGAFSDTRDGLDSAFLNAGSYNASQTLSSRDTTEPASGGSWELPGWMRTWLDDKKSEVTGLTSQVSGFGWWLNPWELMLGNEAP